MPFSRLIPVDTWGVWGHSHWHVFVSLHTRTMNTAEDSTQHSPSQNNLLHRDGQQNLQPCPETALPVLSPGQSIAAEFGASSRGRKRARRISPTRQKTREGILEWKEERTERSYNKTQAETQTVRTLVIFSIEMQVQKFCYLTIKPHCRIDLVSSACRGTAAFSKRPLRERAPQVTVWFILMSAQRAVNTALTLKSSPRSLLPG